MKLVLMLAVVFVLWVGTAIVAYNTFETWPERGTFGDMFGSVNALFSGLAFAGLIYALFLQRTELALQREELKLTRTELSRTADAQLASEKHLAQQARIMKRSVENEALLWLIKELQEQRVIDARRHVIQVLWNGRWPIDKWLEEDRKNASLVCSTYDVAAIIIRGGIISVKTAAIFVANWGPSLRKCYAACKPFMEEMRKEAGPKYWDDFAWLDDQARLLGIEVPNVT